jgi:uncharacterized membrane protein
LVSGKKEKPIKKSVRPDGAPPSGKEATKEPADTEEGKGPADTKNAQRREGGRSKELPGLLASPARKLTAVLLVTGLIVLVGCLLLPSVVWDQFVYRYFWGSTEADAVGHPVNGVTEDYNLISTSVYGILLACAVYLIHHEFQKRKIKIDTRYIMALIPWVFFGTLTRALEDSGYFSLPAAYVFIAPQIYVLVGGFVIALTLLSSRNWSVTEQGIVLSVVSITMLVSMLACSAPDVPLWVLFLASIAPIAMWAVIMYLHHYIKMDTPTTLFLTGLQAVAGPLFLMSYWCAYPGSWGPVGEGNVVLHPVEGIVVPVMALGVTVLILILFRWMASRSKKMGPLASNISTMIIFGHMMDAAATYRALDFYNYGEKHVLPNTLIVWAGTGLVMFPLKAIAMGFVLYVLEVEFRKDLSRAPMLRGLLRAALLILGLSPGLRDLFRLVMGV